MFRNIFVSLLALGLAGAMTGCQVHTGHRDLDGTCWLAEQWRSHLSKCCVGAALFGASTLLETSEAEEEMNQQWREGAGFNNPNPERIRNGQEPVDF